MGPYHDMESHQLGLLVDNVRRCREHTGNVARQEHRDSLVLLECTCNDVSVSFEDHPGAGVIDTLQRCVESRGNDDDQT